MMETHGDSSTIPGDIKPLKVIGAGWARTGIYSIKNALEILGITSYHMVEVHKNKDWKFWSDLSDSKDRDADFSSIFETRGFSASFDFPSSVYYKQQMKNYPNAKVILTVRDPEDWYKSCCRTIFTLCPDSSFCEKSIRDEANKDPEIEACNLMLRKVISKDCFNEDWAKASIIAAYKRHIEEVKKYVPADRLLVIDLNNCDGWEPLCKFLGVPKPKVPYPYENESNWLLSFNKDSVWGYLWLLFLMIMMIPILGVVTSIAFGSFAGIFIVGAVAVPKFFGYDVVKLIVGDKNALKKTAANAAVPAKAASTTSKPAPSTSSSPTTAAATPVPNSNHGTATTVVMENVVEDKFAIYARMRKVVPDSAIRALMLEDKKFSTQEIDTFLGVSEVEDKFTVYARMLKVAPEAVVRSVMLEDKNLSAHEIDKFLESATYSKSQDNAAASFSTKT